MSTLITDKTNKEELENTGRCGANNKKTKHGCSNFTNTVIILSDITWRGYKCG